MGGTTSSTVFHALVEQTPSPMAVLDSDGGFIFVNGAFARLFGEGISLGDFEGVDCAALLTEEAAREFGASILPRALAEGFEGNLPTRRTDRPNFPLHVRLSPVRTESETTLLSLEVLSGNPTRRASDEIVPEPVMNAASEWAVPILPVAERVIVVPVIGPLDVRRSNLLLRFLLSGISSHRAKAVILDVSELSAIDQRAADYLAKAVMAARLKGAYTIVSGVSAEASEALADVVVAWTDIATVGDLKTGLTQALASVGLKLEPRSRRELPT